MRYVDNIIDKAISTRSIAMRMDYASGERAAYPPNPDFFKWASYSSALKAPLIPSR